MSNDNKTTQSRGQGFTIVEMIIIAPIVILAIGAFISVIVGMTGEVLSTRGANVLAYEVQDTLNRIEEDVKLSTTFLAANSVTIPSPQGFNNTAVSGFANVGSNSTMLILNTVTTTENPLSLTSGLVYLTNLPNACASADVIQNTPMTMNVIYFLKDSTLWRRSVLPSNYLTAGCVDPWQQPSCAPGITGTYCRTQDIRLIDGVDASSLTVQYFNAANGLTENTVASGSGETVANRSVALQSATTVGVTLNVTKTAAGREIAQSGTIRATKLDIYASSTAPTAVPVIPSAPAVIASTPTASSATFTWPVVGGATTYNIDYNINGGAWIAGFSGSSARTYTVNTGRNNIINVRVRATNTAGTSGYGTTAVTIPAWIPFVLENEWTDYGSPYSTGAYTIMPDSGVVALKGLVKRAGTAVGGETIARLPVGLRPGKQLIYEVTSNNTAGRVDIYPDGTIRIINGDAAWFSLEGIQFLPSGSPYVFTALPLSNGWVNYGGSWETAGYTADGIGRTQLQGLVGSGIVADNTVIGTLPAARRPSEVYHIAAANSIHGTIGLNSTQGVLAKAGGNGFLSLNTAFYPASYTTWTNLTLQAGWVTDSRFTAPQVTKSVDGIVTLKGFMRSGATANGTVITTLPLGYRPAERTLMTTTANLTHGRIDILPGGNVEIYNVSNVWATIDGISFVAP